MSHILHPAGAEPGYLSLYRSGELQARAERLERRLAACDLCPRRCGIDRLRGEPCFCRSGRLPIVAAVCRHDGEEPPISGTQGSGTIFFANCNMSCVYCQNHQISQGQISQDWRRRQSQEISCRALAERMLYLQDELGCHNINLVTPSHFIPQVVRALVEAAPLGLHLPLIYNSSGYDSVSALVELDGVIDVYLPDLRYASDENARAFSHAPGYVAAARAAIREMHRQVGDLAVDEAGVARRGLIVRHLILPNGLAGSEESLAWLAAEVSPNVAVSIMAQYAPLHRAGEFPTLSRTIMAEEYDDVLKLLEQLGIENGWVQELDSASRYVPDFDRAGQPFSP